MEEYTNVKELTGKNWVAAMLFAWFLGAFGAHRYYTRKTTSAIVMTVMSITGFLMPITLIWALIDGFALAFGVFKHADGSELYERIDWLGYVYVGSVILGIIGFVASFFILAAIIAAAASSVGM